MNDEFLFERLARHDGSAAVDSAFEVRLYSILEAEMHRRRSLRPALLLAASMMLVLTITAAIAVGSGFIKPPWLDRFIIPSPSPTSTVALPAPSFGTVTAEVPFKVPFEYSLPVGSALQLVDELAPYEVPDLLGFVDSPRSPPSQNDLGSYQGAAGARGIAVLSVHRAWIHPCPDGTGPGMPTVRDAPADFLADLDTIGGMTFTAPETTTVDGRPALATSFDAARCDKGDIHPAGSGQSVRLVIPSRLFLMEVEGKTIMIQLWAVGTDDDLAAWLPMAMEFVESMHFLLDEDPTPS